MEGVMSIQAFSVVEKFSKFSEEWKPKIIGEINDSHVKVAKLKGEFIWHHHEQEDELFYVVRGELLIHLRDQKPVVLRAGEMVVIPRGIEHKPEAKQETWIMMIEPKTTLNTGNVVGSEMTVESPEWI
jgi:mannose-6-phosphate isomerase-like protein (cupin superfamily)